MSLPQLADRLPTLACNAVLVGHAQKSDLVWSREDFFAVCEHMLNGNESNFFLIPFRDENGTGRFAKANKARVDRRVSWTWDTITGRAKSPASIGFYPTNEAGESRWGAIDFDAHDGDRERARRLALAAFDLLYRHRQLFVALGTSGSEGWHLFLFTRDFHACSEWTRLLRQVANLVGQPVAKGRVEIFPSETRGRVGYGIRAPGCWNPKHDSFGLIAFENIAEPLRLLRKEREEKSLFLSRSTHGAKRSEFTYRGNGAVYRGPKNKWRNEFAITAPQSRREKLLALIDEVFHQIGRATTRRNVELQFEEASVRPKASLAEHLEEFSEYWSWRTDSWLIDLTPNERQAFSQFTTESVRDAFRIFRSFWQHRKPGEVDFRIVCDHPEGGLAQRLGMSLPGAAKVREKLRSAGIIEMTAAYVPCRYAARYRWTAGSCP